MKKIQLITTISLLTFGICHGQTYHAGFKSFQLKDSTRIYKPNTKLTDSLHYRPVDLDIWYPSNEKKGNVLEFGDLFKLFEKRAISYQDNKDYTGLTAELAQFYVAELGIGTDGQKLLGIKTSSFAGTKPSPNKHPIVIYMAGFNGMGFENYKILESLAQNGFLVISIWSVGRYPGDMTNEIADMLEQVYDAEFALKHLRKEQNFNVDLNNIGVLASSWGGMSAAVLVNRNKSLKSMISMDGSETHYFGDTDTNFYANGASAEDNDQYIQEIYDSELINPEKQDIRYLYFESGDKLDEFTPTKEFNYFKKLNSEKYYLRFKNGTHGDFSCIPSVLRASKNAVQIYNNLEGAAITFFNESLKNKGEFQSFWEILKASDATTTEPYDLTTKTESTIEIIGFIRSKEHNKELPYVNIGILSKEIGTVSDTKGKFTLNLKEKWENDTIRISSIGYKSIEVLAKDIVQNEQPILFHLEEEISELGEVIVTAKAFKKRTLGNKTKSKFIGTGFSYDQLGAEMGIKINISKKPTFVDTFNFFVSYNRLSAESIFRLNIYTVKKNRPSENILKENILIPIEAKETGSFSIDLKPYDIILTEDVIVTLEWVENKGENNKGEAIFFPLGLFSNGTIHKYSSQGKFKKFSSMGVGFNIEVRY